MPAKNNEKRFLPLERLEQAAECLRCLAHPHRLRIVEILLEEECPVGELALRCSLSQPSTSEHLRQMNAKGLLSKERRGHRVYYHVCGEQLAPLFECIRRRYGKERHHENR